VVPHGDGDDTERAVNKDMSAVARRIGLAVHEVRVRRSAIQLGFGATVQAHVDTNGIGRVLDTARVFPPEDYMTTTLKNVESVGRVLLPEEMCRDRVVMAARGKKKTLRRGTVVKPSSKKGKEGQWVVKFDKDGKSFATPVEEIHLIEFKKVTRSNAAHEAFLPSAPNNLSIYWRLLRPELLTLLKDKDYGDGLDEAGLSSDAFCLFAQNGSDFGKHDARIRVATEFLMAVQVPKVAEALAARAHENWRNGEELTSIFHHHGVNMRHAGAVLTYLTAEIKAQEREREADAAKDSESADTADPEQTLKKYKRAAGRGAGNVCAVGQEHSKARPAGHYHVDGDAVGSFSTSKRSRWRRCGRLA
jgi:hypothetical protein